MVYTYCCVRHLPATFRCPTQFPAHIFAITNCRSAGGLLSEVLLFSFILSNFKGPFGGGRCIRQVQRRILITNHERTDKHKYERKLKRLREILLNQYGKNDHAQSDERLHGQVPRISRANVRNCVEPDVKTDVAGTRFYAGTLRGTKDVLNVVIYLNRLYWVAVV